MIIITKFGPWLEVNAALGSLPILIRESAIWGMRKASERLRKIVIDHIDNQDLGWTKLDPKTVTGDPRILVDTEAYRNAIQSYRVRWTYFTGVRHNEYNNRGIRIVDYALAHEYGLGVPIRPLWEPSIKELGGKRGVQSIVTTVMFNKMQILRSKGISVKMGATY